MVHKYEISVVILRVTLGVIFFIHGLVKFQDSISGVAGWFSSIGLPGFLAYGVAIVELVGGALLILGLFSKVVSVLLAIIMVGAIAKVKLAVGFLGNGQMAGYELDLALLAMSIFIAVNGSRAFALDTLINRNKKENNTTTIN